MKFFVWIITYILMSFDVCSAVWIPENSWLDKDAKGELKYELLWQEFIKDKKIFNAKFYQENGLKIDCADLATSAYAIFSAYHKLPILLHNTKGKAISNLDNNFDHLKNYPTGLFKETINGLQISPRLKAFINHITIYTDTYTLMRDSFLIKLIPEFLKEGVLYMRGKESGGGSGHTKIISRIDTSDPYKFPIETVMVSVPREVKKRFYFSNLFTKYKPSAFSFNFRKFYPSIYTEKAGIGYIRRASLNELEDFGIDLDKEQFNYQNKKFKFFSIDLAYLIYPDLKGEAIVNMVIRDIILKLNSRKSTVMGGYKKCVIHRNDCDQETNFRNWVNYSTPSRDKDILDTIQSVSLFLTEFMVSFNQNLYYHYNTSLLDKKFELYWLFYDLDKLIDIDIEKMEAQGFQLEVFESSDSFKISTKVPLLEIIKNWQMGQYSSDPMAHFLERWGYENFFLTDFL